MKIGILGSRGIPNAYGGFEQFAEYVSAGLVKRGHAVTVYNSSKHPYQEKNWNGVQIVHCKDPEDRIGTAGQFIYDLNCIRDARTRNFDIVLQLGYTSSSVWYRLWPKQSIHVTNMDGLEWKRSKYKPAVRHFLKKAEKWAAEHSDALVADSLGIQSYLKETYQKESTFIAYGADIPPVFATEKLTEFEVEPFGYTLLMARMEPENNIELVLKGYMASPATQPLLLIGNTGNAFGRYLSATYSDPRFRFIGAIYDKTVIDALRHHCSVYFHGHSVGGTNPSLLEAMAAGCFIAAHQNAFNATILGTDAAYFTSPEDIPDILSAQTPDSFEKQAAIAANQQKIREQYSWELIVQQYERLCTTLVSR